MNIKTSGDTVIRTLIKRDEKQPEMKCGAAIGIDDFAYKRRQTYGTIIVDERTHKPVAILDGRDGTTLREWLKKNKQVKTVTRDRASAYAKAVEEILPDCMQIADRLQLNRNTVKKYLEGDPMILCRSNKRSSLDQYKNFIINCINEGKTKTETARMVMELGCNCGIGNVRQYI